jgi:hypothetical protein
LRPRPPPPPPPPSPPKPSATNASQPRLRGGGQLKDGADAALAALPAPPAPRACACARPPPRPCRVCPSDPLLSRSCLALLVRGSLSARDGRLPDNARLRSDGRGPRTSKQGSLTAGRACRERRLLGRHRDAAHAFKWVCSIGVAGRRLRR